MPSICLVAIQSVRFPNAFLRIDGLGVTQFQGGGSGIVNCQFYDNSGVPTINIGTPNGIVPVPNLGIPPNIGNYEVFELIPIPTVPNGGYAIRSLVYPSAFLRIDGSGVMRFQGGGSGAVNCQYYSSGTYPGEGDFELLNIQSRAPQVSILTGGGNYGAPYYIRSGTFPNAFLRMAASGITFDSDGSGKVNCQFYDNGTSPGSDGSADSDELFYIIPLNPPPMGTL